MPAPAGEIWNCALFTPLPASAEFEVTLTALPRTLAAAAGAVIDPVGAVLSMVNVNTLVTVFPDASAAVMVNVPGAAAPAIQLRVVEAYGPPDGVVTVSAVCVVQLVALRAGNSADAGPEPPSVTVARKLKLPAALGLEVDLLAHLVGAGRRRDHHRHRGRGVVDPHVGGRARS